MTIAVLVHGWGYDASIWDTVRRQLPPALHVETLDFGYFGSVPMMAQSGYAVLPAPTFAEPVIAVGHSLGALWWLTQAGIPWQRLLCINGFPRFTETADFTPAVAPRVLTRMRTQFALDPAAVLADFHTRCGAPGPDTAPCPDSLALGLAWLADRDGRSTLAARHAEVFALSGTNDPIVPAAMSAMAFAGLPAAHCETINAPGHLLPLTHPAQCAGRIARLAA
jgi:pimeloyl-[acyl-carrier protein] methyl ester esterase